MQKDSIKSPTRPLSSASEQSGGSGRLGSSVTRRVRSSPRKPRPISIAGTVPDSKPKVERVSPVKKAPVASKKSVVDAKRGDYEFVKYIISCCVGIMTDKLYKS